MAIEPDGIKTRTFSVEGIDQRLLFGQNDMFLRMVEQRFDSKMVARGDRVSVEGSPADVDRVVRLFEDFVTRVKQGDFITEQYVNYAIGMVKEDGYGPAESISTEELLTNSLRKAIKPKTVGQSNYVDAVNR
ncbi:MAG: hypothetical protein U9R56_07680, partial [candidate division Zixibacteria bacterium]|nr:hypothetical protein [candidate division Zixibacteria bacterium]